MAQPSLLLHSKYFVYHFHTVQYNTIAGHLVSSILRDRTKITQMTR